MGFKLPKLTTDIDCEPIGYPGLVVTCWLNVTYEPKYKPPEKPKAWELPMYYEMARVVESVTFPPEFTSSGEAFTVTLPDAHAAYDLYHSEGFEQWIINWAIDQYRRQRQQRLEAEAKN